MAQAKLQRAFDIQVRFAHVLETISYHRVCRAFTVVLAEHVVGLRDAIECDFQIRALRVPTWVAYLPMPVGFLLAALEFARYPLVAQSMFDRRAADADSL